MRRLRPGARGSDWHGAQCPGWGWQGAEGQLLSVFTESWPGLGWTSVTPMCLCLCRTLVWHGSGQLKCTICFPHGPAAKATPQNRATSKGHEENHAGCPVLAASLGVSITTFQDPECGSADPGCGDHRPVRGKHRERGWCGQREAPRGPIRAHRGRREPQHVISGDSWNYTLKIKNHRGEGLLI